MMVGRLLGDMVGWLVGGFLNLMSEVHVGWLAGDQCGLTDLLAH